jgi:hypothetical protein
MEWPVANLARIKLVVSVAVLGVSCFVMYELWKVGVVVECVLAQLRPVVAPLENLCPAQL